MAVLGPLQAQNNFSEIVASNTQATALANLGGFPIVGVTNGSNAVPGNVGEYLTASGTTTAGSSAIVNPCSLTLTPGDWDVQGSVSISMPTGTTPTDINCGLTTTPLANAPVLQKTEIYATFFGPPGPAQDISSPRVRFNVSVSTVVYLSTGGVFSGTGPFTINGQITARRMR
jgi:hypothetical protein